MRTRRTGRPDSNEPPVLLVKWYDVTKWLLERVDSFPKNQRFIFGQRIADRALNILEALVEAAYSPRKADLLAGVNRDVRLANHLSMSARLECHWALGNRPGMGALKTGHRGDGLVSRLTRFGGQAQAGDLRWRTAARSIMPAHGCDRTRRSRDALGRRSSASGLAVRFNHDRPGVLPGGPAAPGGAIGRLRGGYFSAGTAMPRMIVRCVTTKISNVGMLVIRIEANTAELGASCWNW